MATDEPEGQGNKIEIAFLCHRNAGGRILVRKFDSDREFIGWSLSSTRQTCDAAFHQLVRLARASLPLAAGDKGRRA
jgi:hypothetical protein